MFELRPILEFSDLNHREHCISLCDLFPQAKECVDFALWCLDRENPTKDNTRKLLWFWCSKEVLSSVYTNQKIPPSDLSQVFLYITYTPFEGKDNETTLYPYTLIVSQEKKRILAQYSLKHADVLSFRIEYKLQQQQQQQHSDTERQSTYESLFMYNPTPVIHKRSNQILTLADIFKQINSIQRIPFRIGTSLYFTLNQFQVWYPALSTSTEWINGNVFELPMMSRSEVEQWSDVDNSESSSRRSPQHDGLLYIMHRETKSTLVCVLDIQLFDRRSGKSMKEIRRTSSSSSSTPMISIENIQDLYLLTFPIEWKLSKYRNPKTQEVETLYGSASLWNPNPDCYYIFPKLHKITEDWKKKKMTTHERLIFLLSHCVQFSHSPDTQIGTTTSEWRNWCIIQHHHIQSQYHETSRLLMDLTKKIYVKKTPKLDAIECIRVWRALKKLFALEMEYNSKFPWFNEQSSLAYWKPSNEDLACLMPLEPYIWSRDGLPVFWTLHSSSSSSSSSTLPWVFSVTLSEQFRIVSREKNIDIEGGEPMEYVILEEVKK
jgi:hypothetical protein